jgi:hypothetical protein
VSNTDPLYIYDGRDRLLRDTIEHLVRAYVIKVEANSYVPGTIYLANDIMAAVKAHEGDTP